MAMIIVLMTYSDSEHNNFLFFSPPESCSVHSVNFPVTLVIQHLQTLNKILILQAYFPM